MSALIVPWKKRTSKDHAETIKWSHGNAKHEICIPVLEDLELMFLLPHCLEAKEKVASIASAAHLGAALFRAFPRAASAALRTA